MDKDFLRQQLSDSRQFMFDEGYLNDYFLNLELLEDTKPNFVEKTIVKYFSSSQAYMDELQNFLNTKPLDLANVERLIQKLKGGSGCMGAAKLEAIVQEMSDVFKEGKYDRLHAAFLNIKAEHAALKLHLESYAQMLRQLRTEYPAKDEISDHFEDAESVDSNDPIYD